MTSQDLDSGDEQCECICSIIRSQKNSYVSISHEAPRSTMFQVCSFYLTSPSHLTIRSCMRDIFGARFHCAICVDVDICSNCESAGLPGNLHSSEGGHDSSHILIKVKRVSLIDTHMAHHRFHRFLIPQAHHRLVSIGSHIISCFKATDFCSRFRMQAGVPSFYGRIGMPPMSVTLPLAPTLTQRQTSTRELLHNRAIQPLHYLTRPITIS